MSQRNTRGLLLLFCFGRNPCCNSKRKLRQSRPEEPAFGRPEVSVGEPRLAPGSLLWRVSWQGTWEGQSWQRPALDPRYHHPRMLTLSLKDSSIHLNGGPLRGPHGWAILRPRKRRMKQDPTLTMGPWEKNWCWPEGQVSRSKFLRTYIPLCASIGATR